jgi:hypothetical protein
MRAAANLGLEYFSGSVEGIAGEQHALDALARGQRLSAPRPDRPSSGAPPQRICSAYAATAPQLNVGKVGPVKVAMKSPGEPGNWLGYF